MSRKIMALVALAIGLVPPTILCALHVIDSTAFAALSLALMGGVATYIHSVALEDAAEKGNPSTSTASIPPKANDGR